MTLLAALSPLGTLAVLWFACTAILASAAAAFWGRRFRAFWLLVPAFVVLSSWGAWETDGAGIVSAMVWLADTFVIAACGLFLIDRRYGVWAFDMTYAAVMSWVAAPAALVVWAVPIGIEAARRLL